MFYNIFTHSFPTIDNLSIEKVGLNQVIIQILKGIFAQILREEEILV